MYLQYGAMQFNLIRISDFQQVLAYTEDETSYLYNSIDIRCQLVLNDVLNNFGANAGQLPPSAYLKVLTELKKIRQQLIITADSPDGRVTVLKSPLDGMTTDFRFGPKCTVIECDPFHGAGSIWIDCQFHTDLGCVDQDYLLSNRYNWTVSHDPDTYAAVHHIEGEAHFRVDKMLKDKVSPDQLRAKFIIPPPTYNFRRNPPTITIHPGGDVASYSIDDVEQMLNGPGLQAFGATRIEIETSRNYESGLMTSGSAGEGGVLGGAWNWTKRNGKILIDEVTDPLAGLEGIGRFLKKNF